MKHNACKMDIVVHMFFYLFLCPSTRRCGKEILGGSYWLVLAGEGEGQVASPFEGHRLMISSIDRGKIKLSNSCASPVFLVRFSRTHNGRSNVCSEVVTSAGLSMDCPAYVPSRQCSYPSCMFRIVLMLLACGDWVPPDADVYPGVENLNALFAHQRRIPNDYCKNDFDTEYKDMLILKVPVAICCFPPDLAASDGEARPAWPWRRQGRYDLGSSKEYGFNNQGIYSWMKPLPTRPYGKSLYKPCIVDIYGL